MNRRMRIDLAAAWLAIGLALMAFQAAAQSNGQALMRAGNELFRAGQYELALERYRSAAAAGYDTPLLRYNEGIANYRLGNYLKAELAFEDALADPDLESLATYNLGLARLAAGWPDLATEQFDRVLALRPGPELEQLARRALDTIEADDSASRRVVTPADRPRYREPDPPIGELRFRLLASYGTDNNVYRTPSAPYVDLAQSGQPLISPSPQSASYMPIDMLVRYLIDSPEQHTRYKLSYRLNGGFYDALYSNADEVTQRFEIGADVDLEGKHQRRLETAFFGITHDETNFDPDTGLDRDLGGQDISNRFSYQGAGLESRYDHELTHWSWGFDARIERRSYEDTPLVPRYDHEFYLLALRTALRLNEQMSVGLQLRSYRRVYDVRRARDIDGVLSNANPALEYAYSTVRLLFERSLSRSLNLTASYLLADRADNFEGYGDYEQNALTVGLSYRPGSRLRVELDVIARTYDYPNAYAFNVPAGGAMNIDSTDAEFGIEYRFSSRLSVWSEVNLFDESSTDPRITFSRTRATVGIRWRR